MRFLFSLAMFLVIAAVALWQSRTHTSPLPIRFIRAQDQLQHGKEADARKEFDTALAVRPDDPVAFMNVLETCVLAKSYKLAIEYGERAVKICDHQPAEDQANLWRTLAEVYTFVEQTPHQERAIHAAERAHQLAPDDNIVANTYGYLLADNAAGPGPQIDTAITVLKKALVGLKTAPKNVIEVTEGPRLIAMTEDSYGWALYKNGQYADAITTLCSVIADYPQKTEPDVLKVTYYHMGMAFAAAGETAQARNAFSNAIFCDPQYAEAISGRAALDVKPGNPQLAPNTDRGSVSTPPLGTIPTNKKN